jgi:hypothetical protein
MVQKTLPVGPPDSHRIIIHRHLIRISRSIPSMDSAVAGHMELQENKKISFNIGTNVCYTYIRFNQHAQI